MEEFLFKLKQHLNHGSTGFNIERLQLENFLDNEV